MARQVSQKYMACLAIVESCGAIQLVVCTPCFLGIWYVLSNIRIIASRAEGAPSAGDRGV